MLWECLLEERVLSYAAALNETMSLTWYSIHELDHGIQLPSSLQSLTVGNGFDKSLEGIQLEREGHTTTQQLVELEVRHSVQPDLGGYVTAQQPAKFDERSLACS